MADQVPLSSGLPCLSPGANDREEVSGPSSRSRAGGALEDDAPVVETAGAPKAPPADQSGVGGGAAGHDNLRSPTPGAIPEGDLPATEEQWARARRIFSDHLPDPERVDAPVGLILRAYCDRHQLNSRYVRASDITRAQMAELIEDKIRGELGL